MATLLVDKCGQLEEMRVHSFHTVCSYLHNLNKLGKSKRVPMLADAIVCMYVYKVRVKSLQKENLL